MKERAGINIEGAQRERERDVGLKGAPERSTVMEETAKAQ
jgi:hypothetical protein